jgi:hypothetical protein
VFLEDQQLYKHEVFLGSSIASFEADHFEWHGLFKYL